MRKSFVILVCVVLLFALSIGSASAIEFANEKQTFAVTSVSNDPITDMDKIKNRIANGVTDDNSIKGYRYYVQELIDAKSGLRSGKFVRCRTGYTAQLIDDNYLTNGTRNQMYAITAQTTILPPEMTLTDIDLPNTDTKWDGSYAVQFQTTTYAIMSGQGYYDLTKVEGKYTVNNDPTMKVTAIDIRGGEGGKAFNAEEM